MNCRKVSSLLSAYIDRELTGAEMLDIREHVERCAPCRAEHQSLVQTKRLLSTLALQTPRAELEQLLVVKAERVPNPSLLSRVLPPEWNDAMLFRWEGVGSLGSPRLRPLAATALLSLAGLCLATASLSGPNDEASSEMPQRSVAFYINPSETLTHVPIGPMISDLDRRTNDAGTPEVTVAPVSFGGTIWGTMATPGLPNGDDRTDWNQSDLGLSAVSYRSVDPYHRPMHPLSIMLVSSRQP